MLAFIQDAVKHKTAGFIQAVLFEFSLLLATGALLLFKQ
jgi:hypothetical protein